MTTAQFDPFDESDGHPDLIALGRGPLLTFNAAVTTARMFHPASIHPDIAALDAVMGRKFAIISDWIVKQVKGGWPLDKAVAEAMRRVRVAEGRSGGVR